MDNDSVIKKYMQITGGNVPKKYEGSEEQGRRIVRCSILKETNLEYSNSTSAAFPYRK